MYRLARKFCEPRGISAFVTDAIVCHPNDAQRKKLEAATLAYKHPDGTNMFRIKPNSNVVVCACDPPITPDVQIATQASPWVDYCVDDAMGEARAIVKRGESVFCKGSEAPVAHTQLGRLSRNVCNTTKAWLAHRIPIWPAKTSR